MLSPSNNYAITVALPNPSLEGLFFGYGLTSGVKLTVKGVELISLHNFSAIIRINIFFEIEVPPFHLEHIMCFIISMLTEVELVVELGWNFM